MSVAIITGTTSGLGRKYVDALINECPEIDEIWMIARRADRLQAIAEHTPQMRFYNLPLDLSEAESFKKLSKTLADKQPKVSALINNAGINFTGDIKDMPASQIQTMINLNITGSTLMIKTCLPYMQPHSFILQVASVSSFVANPHQTVYSATKSYEASFANGLRHELAPKGINVCLAYPGNMETEMNHKLLNAKKKTVINLLPYLNTEKFAHKTIQMAKKGRASYTMLPFYKAFRVVAKLVPHAFLVRFTRI